VGVTIVLSPEELYQSFDKVFEISREALVQNFIQGREMTCGVLDQGWRESAYPLLPTEIIPKISSFFDYRAKYEPGGSDEITPPPNLKDHLVRDLQKAAILAHRILGAKGFSRTDMILAENGKIYMLELNTIPGLTEQSLLPKAAQASGISFQDLLDHIIRAALK